MIYKTVVFMLLFSCFLCLINGEWGNMSAGFFDGLSSAFELITTICAPICFWSGLSEIMSKSGFSEKMACFFRPFIGFLFPKEKKDREFSSRLSQNMTANFLGLGNMATLEGLECGKRLLKMGRLNAVSRLIVLNTASIQLLPTSICAVRATLGAAAPYDILPAVWVSSVFSVCVGLFICKLMEDKER